MSNYRGNSPLDVELKFQSLIVIAIVIGPPLFSTNTSLNIVPKYFDVLHPFFQGFILRGRKNPIFTCWYKLFLHCFAVFLSSATIKSFVLFSSSHFYLSSAMAGLAPFFLPGNVKLHFPLLILPLLLFTSSVLPTSTNFNPFVLIPLNNVIFAERRQKAR